MVSTKIRIGLASYFGFSFYLCSGLCMWSLTHTRRTRAGISGIVVGAQKKCLRPAQSPHPDVGSTPQRAASAAGTGETRYYICIIHKPVFNPCAGHRDHASVSYHRVQCAGRCRCYPHRTLCIHGHPRIDPLRKRCVRCRGADTESYNRQKILKVLRTAFFWLLSFRLCSFLCKFSNYK